MKRSGSGSLDLRSLYALTLRAKLQTATTSARCVRVGCGALIDRPAAITQGPHRSAPGVVVAQGNHRVDGVSHQTTYAPVSTIQGRVPWEKIDLKKVDKTKVIIEGTALVNMAFHGNKFGTTMTLDGSDEIVRAARAGLGFGNGREVGC